MKWIANKNLCKNPIPIVYIPVKFCQGTRKAKEIYILGTEMMARYRETSISTNLFLITNICLREETMSSKHFFGSLKGDLQRVAKTYRPYLSLNFHTKFQKLKSFVSPPPLRRTSNFAVPSCQIILMTLATKYYYTSILSTLQRLG